MESGEREATNRRFKKAHILQNGGREEVNLKKSDKDRSTDTSRATRREGAIYKNEQNNIKDKGRL